MGALVCVTAKMCVAKAITSALREARESCVNMLIDLLAGYKKVRTKRRRERKERTEDKKQVKVNKEVKREREVKEERKKRKKRNNREERNRIFSFFTIFS